MIKFKIGELVKQQGLSGRQLAIQAGISPNTAALLIKAKTHKDYNVSMDIIDKVCAVLKVQPANLLYFKNK